MLASPQLLRCDRALPVTQDRLDPPRGAAGSPKRGGTLRFGSQGLSSTDTLEGQNPVTNADFARTYQLYSPLVRVDNNFGIEYDLAEEIIPNSSATEWTIRLRPGVTFHNGKPFTAKDVLFSFERMRKEKFSGKEILSPLNLTAAKVVDAHTLKIPCHIPFSNFVAAMVSSPYFMMVPEGYDPKKPVGTGGEFSISLDTILNIASALDTTAAELLRRAKLCPQPKSRADYKHYRAGRSPFS
jgi:ABC-type transport system substrate-binding protein